MSMKFFDRFDQAPSQKLSQSLTISPKVKVIAKAKDNNLGNKNMPPLTKLSRDFPCN